MKNDLNILTLAPFYRWFIKGFVEAESKCINKNNVIIHHNKLVEIANYIPYGNWFNHVRLYTKNKIADLEKLPENINVSLLELIYLIPDGMNKRMGEKLIKKFEQFINTNNIEFDLIHSHFIWPQGYIGVQLGKIFNCPVVITLHENMTYLNSINKKIPKNVQWTLNNADALIRVNNKDIPHFIQIGANPNRIYYIPNGYNQDFLKVINKNLAREKLGLENDKKILINIARLYKEKGQKFLIEAIEKVVKHNDNFVCYIGGIGPLKNQLNKQITQKNLNKYVKLLDYIPNEEIIYWMNAADIFVLPSLDEGNPTVMFESLGIGLPFIGTNVGGIPEIITSEEYGLLVDPANSNQLANKIITALNCNWNHEKIIQYGQQFTWQKIALSTIDIYKKIIYFKSNLS